MFGWRPTQGPEPGLLPGIGNTCGCAVRLATAGAVSVPRSNFTPAAALFRHCLKKRRITAGLTQRSLAARLNRPQSFVAKYESGERRIDVVEFLEIAEAVGFDPSELIRELR